MSDAQRAMLRGLIDDAALFPPGNAPMHQALAAHADYEAGSLGWMLGRFLCPVSRLDELRAMLPPARTLELGVILDGGSWTADLEAVAAVAADARLHIGALEGRLPEPSAEAVSTLASAVDDAGLDRTVIIYAEPPDSTDAATAVATVGAVHAASTPRRLGAKLRCGGTTAGSVPGVDVVAAFLEAVAATGVPAKATAGLHHPFRSLDETTGDTMHGFVNVVAAAALAGSVDDLAAVVGDDDPGAFSLDADGLRWRRHDLDSDRIEDTRARRFHGFGSCSFTEPTDELAAAGMLVTVP
jgi:hypothetical protein